MSEFDNFSLATDQDGLICVVCKCDRLVFAQRDPRSDLTMKTIYTALVLHKCK